MSPNLCSAPTSPAPRDPAERFGFGRNWSRFLRLVDETRIAEAEQSLVQQLQSDDLRGRSFLDIGCGSGLFSLAARRLGARVHSFDCDRDSVNCTEGLRSRYFSSDKYWTIEQGSVLDVDLAARLGSFDVVYAWGVLHHTGAMWSALQQAIEFVAPQGRLVLALYNDQGWLSRYWRCLKRLYNHLPWLRGPLIAVYAPYLVGLRWLVRRLRARRDDLRGMSLWYDMIDWLGGWPFEVAKPRKVIDFATARGLRLIQQRTAGRRHGCNEFVFVRETSN